MDHAETEELAGLTVRIAPVPWIYENGRLLDLEILNKWSLAPKPPQLEATNSVTSQRIQFPLSLATHLTGHTLELSGQLVLKGNKVHIIPA